MAHRGRKNADAVLAAALAGGKTVREAAALAGVSEQTVYRRRADSEFCRRVDELRAGMVSDACGRLADGMGEAAGVLRALLADPDPHVRHKAAAKLLELGLRVREAVDLERRVVELEAAAAAAARPGENR